MTSDLEVNFGGATILNETGLNDQIVFDEVTRQLPELASLTRWTDRAQGRNQGLLSRDHYVSPQGIFQEFRIAQDAAETDDVVAGIAETTEQLAFNRCVMECQDEAEQNIWDQILYDVEIETVLRRIWRELFITSNCYVAVLYGKKSYKVEGQSDGKRGRKKEYKDLRVPIGFTMLDPLKVLPVGNFMFGQEQLVYRASPYEALQFQETLAGNNSSDLVVSTLIKGRYPMTLAEAGDLTRVTGEQISIVDNYFILDPQKVFRITATRPDYDRFATCRMRAVFELLDMKSQLRQQDRAFLLGAANFIVLVRKGTDHLPAKPGEVAELGNQIRMNPKVPLIVADHRVEVEIITPKLDRTLAPERYNALDSRLSANLLRLLTLGGYSAGTATDDSIKLLRIVAKGMESRRATIRDHLMRKVFIPTWENNVRLVDRPKFRFYPQRISLDFDPNVLAFLQDSRERLDLSRETMLAELDISEEDEAHKRRREIELYDHLFTADDGQDPATTRRGDGRRLGGRTNGGGLNRNSTQSQPGPNTAPHTEINPGPPT